MPTQGEFIGE